MTDRLTRWRLILGGNKADGTQVSLRNEELRLDKALEALYDSDRQGGLGSSCPKVTRWLGDIREFFPASVVRVMQRDALERLDLQQMLLEPEMLSQVEPDVQLVATLMALKNVIPSKTKETARLVVKRVVDQLIKKLQNPMRQAVVGSLNRAVRNRRPKYREIDWLRTIEKNLHHYQKDLKTIIPEKLVGYGRKRSSLADVILCVDQSGSMGTSVVYSAIFGAVMASLPSVTTKVVVFDTSVVDLTEKMTSPVDLLFGVQLGGGTDIDRALAYCQGLVRRPTDTVFVLISDLFEGGDYKSMLKRSAAMKSAGVKFVTLLALNDEGAPSYSHEVAQAYASLGIPSFACTPDMFPDLMACALQGRDINAWASRNEIVTAAPVHR